MRYGESRATVNAAVAKHGYTQLQCRKVKGTVSLNLMLGLETIIVWLAIVL